MNAPKLAALILALPGLAFATGSNLINNGSFENPVIADDSFQLFSSIQGWSSSTNTIEVRRNRVGSAFDGDNFIELDHASGTISQSIATVAGQWYTLSFEYSNRPFLSVSDPSNVQASYSGFNWAFGQTTGASPVKAMVTDQKNDWFAYTVLVQATSNLTNLSFTGTSLDPSNGLGSSLDKVALVTSAVPEPQTYALMALGLGLVGWAARRGRKQAC